ncbi:UvrD/REP helicase [Hokovirus HKV1]|uniref:UvrD/REP helicase n=1 Tax=Hokovirus HKV1 TaxID=1977638 RepID=A0A1V0SEX1_9VIRU|nr:UvrD/REP helicase [Hokovirus HKV1]
MIDASLEQNIIINSIKEDKNVIVNAIPGSGKTTTCLLIANAFPDKKIVIMTYNKKLRYETMQKIKYYNIKNCNVYNYHSFCFNYYSDKCFNDADIELLLSKRTKSKILPIDILLIDEAQDLTPLYYELLCRIYLDNIKVNKKYAQIGIFGDVNQCIFYFNGSSPNYMLYAQELFNFTNKQWSKLNLSKSYRLTNNMIHIINTYFLHNNLNNYLDNNSCDIGKVINSNVAAVINNNSDNSNKGTNIKNSVYYMICNIFEIRYIYDIIQKLLKKYTFKDILILCSSIKSESMPSKILANYLSNNNYPIFIPSTDHDYINDNVINDKITFLTFFQSKGIERKVVFVLGFDDSYLKFSDKKNNQDNITCPEILYVAITRASEKLFLIHHQSNDFCNFIHPDFINMVNKNKSDIMKIINLSTNKIIRYTDTNKNLNSGSSITNFIKYIPTHIINNFLNNITIKTIHRKTDKINVNATSYQTGSYGPDNNKLELEESIKNITGTMIPLYFEYYIKKNIEETQIYKYMEAQKIKTKNSIGNQIINIYEKHILTNNKDISFFLKLSNIYSCYILNSINNLNQIKNYDWITQETLNKTNDRFKKLLLPKYKTKYVFEYNIYYKFKNTLVLYGSIDCVDYNKKIIHEFKCVENILPEHYLQLALYGYIFANMPKFLLIDNVVYINLHSEVIECIITYYDKDNVHLIQKKNNRKTIISTDNFIKNVINVSHPILREKLLSNDKDFKLYITNILTNETKEIIINYDIIPNIMENIIVSKYYQRINEDDLVFKNNNLNIKKKYFKNIIN